MGLFMMLKLLSLSPSALARLLTVIAALALFEPAGVMAQTRNRYDSFRFGVCYYPEQWPESYWEEDARRMAGMWCQHGAHG